jgi:hypothetical protein
LRDGEEIRFVVNRMHDLKNRASGGGKDLRQKADAVGLDGAYLAVFGGMSHNVHGSWHDLVDDGVSLSAAIALAEEIGGFPPGFEVVVKEAIDKVRAGLA